MRHFFVQTTCPVTFFRHICGKLEIENPSKNIIFTESKSRDIQFSLQKSPKNSSWLSDLFWKHYFVLTFIFSLPKRSISRLVWTIRTISTKVTQFGLFGVHFACFSQKWRFYRKKCKKISFGTTFGVITNKLHQKYESRRKVEKTFFWSWATSFCPSDHFLRYTFIYISI